MANYKSNHSGPVIDTIISKGLTLDLSNNGWLKVKSTIDEPVDLDVLTTPGNFTVSNFINGDLGFADYSPINISNVSMGADIVQYVIILNYVFSRTYSSSLWGAWSSVKNSSYIFIQDIQPETTVLNSLWINTINEASYTFLILTSGGWKEFVPLDMMLKSVYDSSGKNTDFYDFVDSAVADARSTYSANISESTYSSVATPIVINWKSICYGNGMFVAVAENSNKIIYSIDTIEWSPVNIPILANWVSVCYGNGKFLAVSDAGSMISSPDGSIWSEVTIPSTSPWVSVIYGNSTFVAIATNGNIIYSSNGIDWSVSSAPIVASWTGIASKEGIFIAIASGSSKFIYSYDAITWLEVDILVSDNWGSISYGNGIFIAIAYNSNKTLISSDGLIWSEKVLPSIANWQSINYGNGVFLVVASTGNIISTVDGITWIAHQAIDSNNWSSIAYGNYTFVIISSTIIESLHLKETNVSEKLNFHINDITRHVTQIEKDEWTSKINPLTATNEIVTMKSEVNLYTDGKVTEVSVTVNDLSDQIDTNNQTINTHASNGLIHVSEVQKTDWSSRAPGNHTHLSDGKVEIDASKIVSGELDLARIPAGSKERIKEVSSDAERFALTTDPITGVQNGDLVYVNTVELKKFYAVVDDTQLNTEAGYVLYNAGIAASIQWSNVKNKPTTISGYGITDAYSKLEIAAAIQNAIDNGIIYTDSAIDEFLNSFESALVLTSNGTGVYNWRSICYGDGKFLAIADGTNNIMISYDGLEWAPATNLLIGAWKSVAYGNGIFVAVDASNNYIVSSPDGITWTQRTSPVVAVWQSVTYGNGLFVAVADGVQTMYSSDGITWTEGGAAIANCPWKSVTYGNAIFVAVANPNTASMYSFDCLNWAPSDVISNSALYSIIYGNGIFVAVGDGGLILTSPDALTWTQRTSPVIANWNTISYGGGLFVIAARDTANALYSKDGINWTEIALPFSSTWISIVYGNGKFVAVPYNSLSVLNIVYASGSINKIIDLQQTAIDAMTILMRDSLYISGVLTREVIATNSQQINTNANNINILSASVDSINAGLVEVETLSAQILALVQ